MSYIITNQCIGCGRCQIVCPTSAIQLSGSRYQINSNLCNNCFGFDGIPFCMAACSIDSDCIVESREERDYWKKWFLKYYRLFSRLRPNPPRSRSLRTKAHKLLSTKFSAS